VGDSEEKSGGFETAGSLRASDVAIGTVRTEVRITEEGLLARLRQADYLLTLPPIATQRLVDAVHKHGGAVAHIMRGFDEDEDYALVRIEPERVEDAANLLGARKITRLK
jgi:hypothetical protein